MRRFISRHFDFINAILSHRYKMLLVGLIGMIIIPGFIAGSAIESFVTLFINAFVLHSGINCIQESKKQYYIGIFIATAVILLNQIHFFKHSTTIDFYLSFFIFIVFYCYLAYRLLIMLIKTERVNVGVLYASVNVYLLIGIIGAYGFILIENANPGSLANHYHEEPSSIGDYLYFSFVTLSTLGYGDITPVAPAAKSLTLVLSTLGPLYLTVLVALLVSRFEHE